MARFLAENEALVERATMGLRGPDGNFLRSVKLYEIVTVGDVNPKTGMTQGEEALCNDIGKVLAEKFGQYIAGSRKAATR